MNVRRAGVVKYPQCVHSTYTTHISLFTYETTCVTVREKPQKNKTKTTKNKNKNRERQLCILHRVILCSFCESVNHYLICY